VLLSFAFCRYDARHSLAYFVERCLIFCLSCSGVVSKWLDVYGSHNSVPPCSPIALLVKCRTKPHSELLKDQKCSQWVCNSLTKENSSYSFSKLCKMQLLCLQYHMCCCLPQICPILQDTLYCCTYYKHMMIQPLMRLTAQH